MSVKIGLLQMPPVHSNVLQSIKIANELLKKRHIQMQGVDLLVLPELAFTGYLFKSREQALPLAESLDDLSTPTLTWAISTAKNYKCGVVVGFIRLEKKGNKLYNSVVLINPKGEVVTHYDKHFLYVIDKSWSEEGCGFKALTLPWVGDGGVKIALAICMDINPKDFVAPWRDFELANFCKKEEVKLLVFSSAWCNRHPNDDHESEIKFLSTVNYWLNRLEPLIGTSTFFICADRVGSEQMALYNKETEGNVTFCGCSCILSLEEPALVDHLSPTAVDLLVIDFEI